ncbi:hypothetical protein R1sor_021481 [Riccia sorocarpa]|uniref:Uncharacterized protein n=1 Tax=Riccia sorocarpa TaxID=122646 RepID=A0ABD3GH66_9MARC
MIGGHTMDRNGDRYVAGSGPGNLQSSCSPASSSSSNYSEMKPRAMARAVNAQRAAAQPSNGFPACNGAIIEGNTTDSQLVPNVVAAAIHLDLSGEDEEAADREEDPMDFGQKKWMWSTFRPPKTEAVMVLCQLRAMMPMEVQILPTRPSELRWM